MRGKYRPHHILEVVLLFIALAGLSASNSNANENSKYLDAVRKFADNVLTLGRDTYGPKHTPLFVDGLNIHTHEPVKWIAPNGDRWILSNLASQQNLFRTLDGLTKITGDPKYRQAAMEAIEYAFANLRCPNGLLYWGGATAYDAQADKVCGSRSHVFKLHLPHYQLMWRVNPETTKQFIEAFWSAHILDWSNLDMNRHGPMEEQLASPWKYEYEGGPVFFESKLGWSLSFWSTGSDLFFAGSMLSNLSGEKEPLIWSKRLARRYVEARNPKIGISAYVYSRSRLSSKTSLQDILANDSERDILSSGMEFPAYGRLLPVWPQICQLLLGQILGGDGSEFREWAIEELTAWGKVAYRKSNNSWVPMLIDGTSLEGCVVKRDSGYGLKGTVLKPVPAGPLAFWAYALAFRVTGDNFMWEMAHSIALGNNFGDIGVSSTDQPKLETDTDSSDPYALLGFLELYARLQKKPFLKISSSIGDNILSDRLYMRFFVPSKEALYTKFDYVEPLVLLHLDAAVNARPSLVPKVWPSISSFSSPYYGGQAGSDIYVIYSQTRKDELTILLLVAAWSGNTGEVETLISKGADVNAHFKFDSRIVQRIRGEKEGLDIVLDSIHYKTNTPLHYAAEKGHKEVSELLIAKGADINARNLLGETPLYYAVEKGHKEMAEMLIHRGADFNAKNSDGDTPLRSAAANGYKDMVELLIAEGANVNVKNIPGDTPLHSAAANGYKDMVELLIAKGADVNAKNNNGQTPVDIALIRNRNEVIKLLVEKGADVSLHVAARLGYLAKVESLIQEGAYINAKNESGQTALHYAARTGRKDIAELLIAKGADVNAKNNRGQTPVDIAASRRRNEVVKLLIAKGADVSSIHLAAYLGDAAKVMNFIEQGSDVNTKDREEDTPLHYAAMAGSIEVSKLLLSRGADIKAKDKNGATPLHRGSVAGHRDLAELLITKGADIDARDDTWSETPLHWVVSAGHRDVAELLIVKGADVNAKEKDGRTPLQVAKDKGYTEIVELLRKHGAKE